jgi:hypothetical protein
LNELFGDMLLSRFNQSDDRKALSKNRRIASKPIRESMPADKKPKNRTFLPEKMFPHLGQRTLEDTAGSVKPYELATPPQTRALRPSKFAEHLGQFSNPFIELLTLELNGGVAVRLERIEHQDFTLEPNHHEQDKRRNIKR